jgi:hypothetical protein
MKKLRYLFYISVIFLFAMSCRKIEQMSAIPNIKYNSFTIFDTTDILGNNAKGGRLKFYFEDGDGDLGLEDQSGDQTDTNNLIFTMQRKINGVMLPAPDNDPLKPSSYRIPYMTREGQNKILKGTISVTFLYPFYTPQDTIMYDFYIIDRASNKSNTVSTNEIVVSVNKTY